MIVSLSPGALDYYTGDKVVIAGNATFVDNSARWRGGEIHNDTLIWVFHEQTVDESVQIDAAVGVLTLSLWGSSFDDVVAYVCGHEPRKCNPINNPIAYQSEPHRKIHTCRDGKGAPGFLYGCCFENLIFLTRTLV